MVPRYSRPAMTAIWAPENRFRIWFEIEALAAEAMAELGSIPAEAARTIRTRGDAKLAAIGPADLALSLGHAPTLNSSVPEVVNAILHIGRQARACGKVAGIHCGDGASTRAKLDEGFNFVALGTDVSLLENAAAAQLALVRGAGLAPAGGQY